MLVKKGHGSVSGLAASRFRATSSERPGCSPPPEQGRLKDVTSGLLSLRRAGAGPRERSNRGSRWNRTCGRRAVDGGDWVPSPLSGRGSHHLALS